MAKVKLSDRLLSRSSLIYFIVCSSGILAWIFKTFLMKQGEWGEEPHEFSATIRLIHHLVSVFFIWFIGALSLTHVNRFHRTHRRVLKFSGWSLLSLSIICIFSGTILYHINSQLWLSRAELFHVIVGFLLILSYLLHRIVKGKY